MDITAKHVRQVSIKRTHSVTAVDLACKEELILCKSSI